MKTCKKCNLEYSGERCRPCNNAYHAKYRKLHPEKIEAARSKWIDSNHDKHRAIRNSLNRKWRALNKDKCAASRAIWANKNKEYLRIRNHNRRALLKDRGMLSGDIIKKLMFLQGGKCAVCKEFLGLDYELDHILPIALNGENIDSNMQLLHEKCNQKKHAKHPIDFMRQNGYLL